VAARAAANPDGLSAEEWLRRATVQPNAEIAPGYQPGLMPANYGEILSPEELDDLVAYMLSLE
jgi:mono/diheme cytochrome c family protein